MADCAKCWDSLCCCGWMYRNMDLDRRVEIAAAALGVSEHDLRQEMGNKLKDDHPKKGQE